VFVSDSIFTFSQYVFPTIPVAPTAPNAAGLLALNRQLGHVRSCIEHFFGFVVQKFKGVIFR
jgi:hypothetical protein